MTPRPAQQGTISGPVTLFAVATKLLAFFVMLYAVMERNPASQLVASDSFNQRKVAAPGPVAVVSLDGDVPAVKVMERRWLDLFPGAGMVDGSSFMSGRVLRAELGLGGIFGQGGAEALPRAEQIVASLTRLVAEAPKGLDLALDVKLGVADDMDAADGKLAIQRTRTLARLLSTIDPGTGDVAVGLQPGQPATIALELRLANRAMPEGLMPPVKPVAAAPPPVPTLKPGA